MSDSALACVRLPASVLQNIVVNGYFTVVSLRATCRHLNGALGRDVGTSLGALIAVEAIVVDRDAWHWQATSPAKPLCIDLSIDSTQ